MRTLQLRADHANNLAWQDAVSTSSAVYDVGDVDRPSDGMHRPTILFGDLDEYPFAAQELRPVTPGPPTTLQKPDGGLQRR